MRWLRRAFGWGLALCVLASALWLAGSVATERAVRILVAQMERQGWQVELGETAIAGFPDRLETTLRELRATETHAGALWHFPQLQLVQAIARPGRITITPDPGSSLLDFPYRFAATANTATVNIRPLPPFALRGLSWQAEEPAAQSIGFPSFAARALSVDLRSQGDGRYQTTAEMQGLALPEGPAVSRLFLDMTAVFDGEWTATTAPPSLDMLEVSDLRLDWGTAIARGDGMLTIDRDGWLEGQLDLLFENWPDLLDQLRDAGFITNEAHDEWRRALQAEASDGRDIALPLRFRDRRVSLGPFLLGAAPQLY